MTALFLRFERTESGCPKLPQAGGPPPTERDVFVERCFLLGIHDAGTVARLWKEEQVNSAARRRAAVARAKEARARRREKRKARS